MQKQKYGQKPKWLFLLAALMLTLSASSAAAGEASSCVTCHLDEDALISNLAPSSGKMSAKQSGSG